MGKPVHDLHKLVPEGQQRGVKYRNLRSRGEKNRHFGIVLAFAEGVAPIEDIRGFPGKGRLLRKPINSGI